MRILHVFDHSLPLQSGYVYRSLGLLRAQRERGWAPLAITSSRQGPSAAACDTLEGMSFHRTPALPRWQAALPAWRQQATVLALAQRLHEVASATRPALIHAHSPALNGAAALRVGRALGIPVVYEVRAFWEDAAVDHGTHRAGGLRYRLVRALETHVAANAAHVFTICEGLRADLRARGLTEDGVTVIPNAVEPSAFQFEAPRDPALAAQLGLREGPVLGFIGSFYAYEGLLDLIDALPAVRQVRPDLQVLLVGDGPARLAVQARVAALGLDSHVLLPGPVPQADVPRWASLIDIACYPRRRQRLTELVTPLKPLEAMAQGQVVLASNVGGHRELIHDGDTGCLFPPDDPAQLACAVLECLAARPCWPAWRVAARRFVERERTWTASVERYAPVYARLGNA